jgi:hypothetical protein
MMDSIRFGFRSPVFVRPESAKAERAKARFSSEWGIDDPVGDDQGKDLHDAYVIGVTEWFRRHKNSEDKKVQFLIVQLIAPLAAGIATILAVSGVSKWAVIPSAIATVASSLLASFGLRENWGRLRLMARELGFEIVKFVKGYDNYRDVPSDKRIDTFMRRIDDLSIRSVFAPTKDGR